MEEERDPELKQQGSQTEYSIRGGDLFLQIFTLWMTVYYCASGCLDNLIFSLSENSSLFSVVILSVVVPSVFCCPTVLEDTEVDPQLHRSCPSS